MAKLSEDVQTFIVQRLACFEPVGRVVASVKETYDLVVSKQRVQFYDPTRGVKPPKRWCVIFDATRTAYIESAASIGIAHRTFRLEALHRMAETAESRNNLLLAKELLKQAAEEVGNVYTNRRRLDLEPRAALAQLLGVSPDELPPPAGA